MIHLLLKAPTEAELIAVLPAYMIYEGEATNASASHFMDWNIPIVITPAVIVDGEIVTDAVLSTDFHANLQLSNEADVSILESTGFVVSTVKDGICTFGASPETAQRVWV